MTDDGSVIINIYLRGQRICCFLGFGGRGCSVEMCKNRHRIETSAQSVLLERG